MQLDNTIVHRDVSTYTGDIHLFNNSIVKGDVIVKKSNNYKSQDRVIELRIDSGAVVQGDIIVHEKNMKVKVYIGKDGKVNGEILGAEVIREM